MVMSNIFSLAKKKPWGFTSTYHAWKSVGYAHVAQKNFFPPTSIGFANYSLIAVLKCLLSLLYLVILRYCMYSVCHKENMFFTEWKCLKSDMTDDRS